VTVFVDSSAFYALIDMDDVNNERASLTFASLVGSRPLATHSYVCTETIALLQRRVGLAAVQGFVDDVFPLLSVEWVDEGLHRAATTACSAAGRRNVSFVDWTSFEQMRRRGISVAFAYDEDFAAQGFDLVG
jgi:predicted nucleic acid-binding protein